MSKMKVHRSEGQLPKAVRRNIAKATNAKVDPLKESLIEQANEVMEKSNILVVNVRGVTEELNKKYDAGLIDDIVYEEIDAAGKKLLNDMTSKETVIKVLTNEINNLPKKVTMDVAERLGSDVIDKSLDMMNFAEDIGRFIDLCETLQGRGEINGTK